ncbi:hypothetical protein MTR67_015207 [Solanum verrucosum]|uniref:Uncharacterized protein n=1 Tax=Solanum verrucosum TaxID=315347 RepID=A0AAF0QDM1_SOLVR|nr:hypothetical protein MTR67_015207 [Solanum verrucosum]
MRHLFPLMKHMLCSQYINQDDEDYKLGDINNVLKGRVVVSLDNVEAKLEVNNVLMENVVVDGVGVEPHQTIVSIKPNQSFFPKLG